MYSILRKAMQWMFHEKIYYSKPGKHPCFFCITSVNGARKPSQTGTPLIHDFTLFLPSQNTNWCKTNSGPASKGCSFPFNSWFSYTSANLESRRTTVLRENSRRKGVNWLGEKYWRAQRTEHYGKVLAWKSKIVAVLPKPTTFNFFYHHPPFHLNGEVISKYKVTGKRNQPFSVNIRKSTRRASAYRRPVRNSFWFSSSISSAAKMHDLHETCVRNTSCDFAMPLSKTARSGNLFGDGTFNRKSARS